MEVRGDEVTFREDKNDPNKKAAFDWSGSLRELGLSNNEASRTKKGLHISWRYFFDQGGCKNELSRLDCVFAEAFAKGAEFD